MFNCIEMKMKNRYVCILRSSDISRSFLVICIENYCICYIFTQKCSYILFLKLNFVWLDLFYTHLNIYKFWQPQVPFFCSVDLYQTTLITLYLMLYQVKQTKKKTKYHKTIRPLKHCIYL